MTIADRLPSRRSAHQRYAPRPLAFFLVLTVTGFLGGCGSGVASASDPVAIGGPESPQPSPSTSIGSPGPDVVDALIVTFETQGGWNEFTRVLGGGEPVSLSVHAEDGVAVGFAFVAPNGDVYDETSSEVAVTGQPDDLEVTIEQPADGTWTFRVRLEDDSPDVVRLFASVFQAPRPNVAPEASIDVNVNGRTVTVSADGSSDPDGVIVAVLWSFDDEGPFAEGPPGTHWRVQYTYPKAGTYWIQLGLVDDDDAVGPAAVEVTVD